jgi:uncharacterized protein YprB with RNaseH-like and TPR domain
MGDRIEDKLKGKVITVKQGDYTGVCYRMIRRQKDMASDPVVKYINRTLHKWETGKLHNIRGLPPELSKMVYFRPEETIFMDTETLGLSYRDAIFLIGVSYIKKGEVIVDLLLARNPWEEEAMMRKFNEISSRYKYMISYNGQTFDNRRIITRNRNFQIQWSWPDDKHLDLYQFIHPFIKNKLGESQKTSKLGDVERILFGLEREDDLPSAEVPAAYEDYWMGGKPDKLVKAIRHNDIDVFSLVAIYLRIMQDPEFIPRIKEFKKKSKWREKKKPSKKEDH